MRNFISDREGYLSIITVDFQLNEWSLLMKTVMQYSPIFSWMKPHGLPVHTYTKDFRKWH